MSEEKAPAVNIGTLALRAAVAYRVKEKVAKICDAVIKANADHIKATPGLRSTAAELPVGEGADQHSVHLTTFSRTHAKASFQFGATSDAVEAFKAYADERNETEYVVRPAFAAAVLAKVRRDEATGMIFDPDTGEEVPGIVYITGGTVLSVSPTWTNEGKKLVDAELGFVDTMLENLPALTAADFGRSSEAAQ
ncbi:hypothetical protein ABT024_05325 [Streptomyces sp. NPDC002812]|uniref:hypothetical protein n=1 Tax=Streptomyces sp. NPDC002812 TaxID=3154434 RepID=UPI00332FF5D9